MPGPVEVFFFKVRGRMDRSGLRRMISLLPGDRVCVLIDRDSAVSEMHLRSAFMHAARSILAGRSRAKDPSMEVLRYVAGSRQVGEGVTIAGPNEGTEVLIIAMAPSGWPVNGDGDPLTELIMGDLSTIDHEEEMIEIVGGIDHWGGASAARRILGADPAGLDPELAVLERIALADLR
jgi:tRNA threonylcarbamoyladenosine modification (KEOPS) complex Cgi121 subunit